MDAAERFDLEALNLLPWGELAQEAAEDGRSRREMRSKVDELLARVRQETDDTVAAGSLLRRWVVTWYHRSREDPAWSEEMPARWGGIFTDSKEAGGRRHPWLPQRMLGATRSDPLPNPLGRLLHRRPAPSPTARGLDRSPAQLWAAEVAQALLDDLASHPRPDSGRLSLVRLSELAGRRTPDIVNEALAGLLSSPTQGPFVLLHPNRYPDCDLVAIRPPTRGATGASLSYVLHVAAARPSALPSGTGIVGEGPLAVASEPGLGGGEGGDLAEGDGDPWSSEDRSEEAWKALLAAMRKRKKHLAAPPKDFRQLATYRSLRSLLVSDAASRASFLSTKWRGRPAGLALLASLLTEGSLTMEAATDYEYLESELGDVERGDPDRHPDPPEWRIAGGTVRREGNFQAGYRYRFEGGTPPP